MLPCLRRSLFDFVEFLALMSLLKQLLQFPLKLFQPFIQRQLSSQYFSEDPVTDPIKLAQIGETGENIGDVRNRILLGLGIV